MEQGNPRQAALMAYLAGIIDGEGTIRIQQNPQKTADGKPTVPQYMSHMSLGMIQREIPELLKKTFGGTVRLERVRHANRRDVWRWHLQNRAKVIAALKALRPYLRVKTAQADLALEYEQAYDPYLLRTISNKLRKKLGRNLTEADRRPQEYYDEIQRRQETYLTMRKLNAVGAAATTERVDA